MFRKDREQALRVDHLHADVVGRSVRGGIITFGAQGIKVVVQIGTVMILSRLLVPQVFGLLAMVAALIEILDQFKDLGLSMATIQKPDLTHQQVTALFWINAAIGTGLMLLLIAGAPLIADFYHQPTLIPVTRWLALGFLIGGITTQHWALLRRQMRFTVTASIDLGSEVSGMIIAVIAALHGAGLWALVIQRLSYASLVMLGTWSASGWLPGWPRRTSGVGALLSFGFSVTGSGIANLLARNLDQVLIGWYWNPRLLGFYERAYKLCMTPLNNINGPLYSVGMPALSRLSGDAARYRSTYIGLSERLAMLTIPGAVFVIASSDWVVGTMLGRQWGESAPILAWLAFGAMLLPVVNTTGLIFVSQDRATELLKVGLVGSAISAIAILIGLPFGPVGVAAGFACGMNFLRIPFCFWMAGRRGPVTLKDLCLPLVPSIAAACAVFLVGNALHHIPALAEARAFIALIVSAAAAVAVALLVYLSFARSRNALMFFRTLTRARHFGKATV